LRAPLLAALGLAALAGCSATRAEGTPSVWVTSTSNPPTVPAATAPSSTVTTTTTIATTTSAATTTTVAPTTTVETTTTTTVPPTVPVPAMAEAMPVIGTKSGENTKILQNRLLELGFWNAGPDGKYGITTKQAVMAFQKYVGLEATAVVDEARAAALTAQTTRAIAIDTAHTLVEVDKGRQLLFFVVNGQTQWVFNTSTGTGQPYEEPNKNDPTKIERGVSITPDGDFKVNRERPVGWWEGDLGEIYRPKYFRGGIAVHGSNSIPNYPASHGCVRVSVPAMDFIWDANLMPMGMAVWVHS
jgi:peptidoglycan hydrolase-like protein with peptidoglycan-binding domain